MSVSLQARFNAGIFNVHIIYAMHMHRYNTKTEVQAVCTLCISIPAIIISSQITLYYLFHISPLRPRYFSKTRLGAAKRPITPTRRYPYLHQSIDYQTTAAPILTIIRTPSTHCQAAPPSPSSRSSSSDTSASHRRENSLCTRCISCCMAALAVCIAHSSSSSSSSSPSSSSS